MKNKLKNFIIDKSIDIDHKITSRYVEISYLGGYLVGIICIGNGIVRTLR